MSAYRTEVLVGQTVFLQGDAATTAFLIENGRIEVSTIQRGEQHVLSELGPGALLGELAVLDNSPRTTTARALTNCVLTPIDRRQFAERLAVADPIVRALLMSQFSRHRSTLAALADPAISNGATQRPQNEDRALEKIRLESELSSALEHGDLEVLLQPIIEIATGTVAGYEALTRWHHSERGPISPTEFIRLAEETSLIVPVGHYVLARVCNMLADLAQLGRQPLPFIALNVSARQLDDPSLVDHMLAQLHERGLPPDRLKIEITESLVLDQPRVAEFLRRCHDAGIAVALDDFGTGYSNLGPLLTLDFDQIKLDQSFVHILDQPRGAAVVQAIATLARELNCDLVAEGVETEAQLESLRHINCRYAQGWLVGRPVSLDKVLNA